MNGDTLIVHHQEIRRRLKARYSPEDVHDILAFLNAHGTLRFAPLPTGLFPAAELDPAAAAQSGYGNVWVRDNVYIALAHEKAGRLDSAVAVVTALSRFYGKYSKRFKDIVAGLADPNIVMNRPHVRFDGLNLAENKEPWAHAQNDALGYFLWMYCRLARRGLLEPDGELLALFALYFERIRYWQDEDSGHWEEERKVEASSIGPVVAGLRQLRELLDREARHGVPVGQPRRRRWLRWRIDNRRRGRARSHLAFGVCRTESSPLRCRPPVPDLPSGGGRRRNGRANRSGCDRAFARASMESAAIWAIPTGQRTTRTSFRLNKGRRM